MKGCLLYEDNRIIIIVAVIVIAIINAANHTGQRKGRSGNYQKHSTNWNDEHMTQEIFRHQQQASQEATRQTMYAAQNAAEISRAGRHRMQAQQMGIHLQMAASEHQKHLKLCGQVQNRQDLQMLRITLHTDTMCSRIWFGKSLGCSRIIMPVLVVVDLVWIRVWVDEAA